MPRWYAIRLLDVLSAREYRVRRALHPWLVVKILLGLALLLLAVLGAGATVWLNPALYHPGAPATLPPLALPHDPAAKEWPVVDLGNGQAMQLQPDGTTLAWKIPDQLAGVYDLGDGTALEVWTSGYQKRRAISVPVEFVLGDGRVLGVYPDGTQEVRARGTVTPATGRSSTGQSSTSSSSQSVAPTLPVPPAPTATLTFIWPLRGPITQRFGGGHTGIDVACWQGAPIAAMDGGTVASAGFEHTGYGYRVVVNHGDGWQSTYNHLSRIDVAARQTVTKGQALGGCGSTGRSTGPHLHMEIARWGAYLNPLGLLP